MKNARTFFLILPILLLVLILTACGATSTSSAPASASPEVQQQAVQSASAVNTGQHPKMIEFYTNW